MMDDINNNKRRVHIDLQSYNGGLENCLLRETICHVVVRKTSTPHNQHQHPATTGNSVPLSHEKEKSIFQAIGCLPNLQRLDITGFHPHTVSASCLVVLLQEAKKLSHLRLDCIQITTTTRRRRIDEEDVNDNDNDNHNHQNEQEMQELVTVLAQLPSLEEVVLVNCNDDETSTSEYLAKGLAQSPILKVVEIIDTRSNSGGNITNENGSETEGGCRSGSSLAALCSSTSLKILRLRGLRFLCDSHITRLAQQLEQNQSTSVLEELNIMCGIGSTAVYAICQMLRTNTKLQMLGLNCVEKGEHAKEIAQALKDNSSLKTLHLYFREGNVKEIQYHFETLLTTNNNYTLETIRGGWTNATINFYLDLNKSGRKQLLNNGYTASREQWIDFITAQSDVPSTAMYLLLQNPSLCRSS